jgi:hypothetical protein
MHCRHPIERCDAFRRSCATFCAKSRASAHRVSGHSVALSVAVDLTVTLFTCSFLLAIWEEGLDVIAAFGIASGNWTLCLDLGLE